VGARVAAAGHRGGHALGDRLAGVFVLVTLGVATLVFWLGIPIGGLWFLSKVTDSWNGHFLLSLVLIPTAMALFAPALGWLNGLYLRVSGALDSEGEGRRRMRGPLEAFLYAGLVVAVVALVVWFFFFAKYPPEVVW
jgi:hypothetical protein